MKRATAVPADTGRRASATLSDAAANAAAWPSGLHSREELIRVTAYQLYERNGCRPGHALEDWLAAEAQVDAQLQQAPAPAVDTPAALKTSGAAPSA